MVEVKSLLGSKISDTEKVCDSVYVLRTTSNVWEYVKKMAGFHKIGYVIWEGNGPFSSNEEVIRLLEESPKRNYSISLYCSSEPEETYTSLIEDLLEILRLHKIRRVNLVRPDKGYEIHSEKIFSRNILDFIVARSEQRTIMGVTVFVNDSRGFRFRATERPSEAPKIAMSPRLAKTLVNASSCLPGGILLDPFCGSGTILGEAILLGINCIGIDINPKQIDESKKYLKWLSSRYPQSRLGQHRLIVGDARHLDNIIPSCSVDVVVTEPILLPSYDHLPAYSKAMNALDRARKTYLDAILSIGKVLKRGGKAIIVTPEIQTKEGKAVKLELEHEIGDGHMVLLRTDTGKSYFQLGNQSTRWVKRNLYILRKP